MNDFFFEHSIAILIVSFGTLAALEALDHYFAQTQTEAGR